MAEIQKYDVVQFNEKHKWCGSLGIVTDVKNVDADTIYLIGVPIPEKGVAYIRVMKSEYVVEYIGRAVLADSEGEE